MNAWLKEGTTSVMFPSMATGKLSHPGQCQAFLIPSDAQHQGRFHPQPIDASGGDLCPSQQPQITVPPLRGRAHALLLSSRTCNPLSTCHHGSHMREHAHALTSLSKAHAQFTTPWVHHPTGAPPHGHPSVTVL